ncbi:MAG: hypothetical protein IJ035_04820 [Oscillospiraceae bacterium]|nr:hypothetical protein [Oscillospiraceae bacterium]
MFNFNIAITEKEKHRRRVLYAITAAVLVTLFTVGFITVYVNSYNIIHAEPMEVLGFYRTNDGVGVMFFNHFFELFSTK